MKLTREGSETISEQAARWLCLLADGDTQEEAAFASWLSKSPKHIEEFLLATATWQSVRGLAAAEPMSIEAVLSELRSAGAAANVVRLRTSPDAAAAAASHARGPRGSSASWRMRWAAGVAMIAFTSLLGWWAVYSASVFSTAVGEQRTVRLSDGSVLYLNTASRARLRFSERVREVELLDGEALFVVARDAARPFQVVAGATVIRAVGTQFNVRRGKVDTRVSVIEGRVKVGHQRGSLDVPSAQAGQHASPRGSSERPTEVPDPNLLGAGEEVTVGGNGRIVRQRAGDIAQAVAWRERRVVFRAERLEDVVLEINRYGSRHFRIIGERARDTLLTATFDIDSPESLATFLQRYSTLAVRNDGDDFVIEDRAPSPAAR